MKYLKDNELNNIHGGISAIGILGGIAIAITFIASVVYGQIKLKWQKLKNTVFKGNFVEKPSIQIHQEDAIMYIKL